MSISNDKDFLSALHQATTHHEAVTIAEEYFTATGRVTSVEDNGGVYYISGLFAGNEDSEKNTVAKTKEVSNRILVDLNVDKEAIGVEVV